MTQSVRIIADSISAEGIRLTTMELRYPRYVHSEFLTHRAFSRNASSSRAIPVKRAIQMIRDDMAMPAQWGVNKPGMQAGGDMDERSKDAAMAVWEGLGYKAIEAAEQLAAMDPPPHKQIVNRLLEPWSHISVVVTATDWANFFALRNHPAADPTFQELASKMLSALHASTPVFLNVGSWHLPYVDDADYDAVIEMVLRDEAPRLSDIGGGMAMVELASLLLRKISVARCARVSYLTHDGKRPSIEDDMRLFNDLMVNEPLHASPAEHQASPDKQREPGVWMNPSLHGNLRGWCQYRKHFPNESVKG